ncbi:glycosyltransferase [Nocardioides sp.]|uniref:glycosyltransferase n=1 Tax=Nocardioides sp. TaxID=35761 RepID=UPI0031FEF7CF|nr:hypothetical protein [Nocardioides sp.]
MSDAVPEPLSRFLAQSPDSALLLPASAAPEPGKWDRVAVQVADRESLRAFVVPDGVRSATILVALTSAERALALVPRPEWPPCTSLRSRRAGDGTWLVALRFERPVSVADVVAELGRQSAWPDPVGNRGLFVQDGGVVAEDVPPDVLLSAAVEPVAEHPVTGRTPLVLTERSGPLALGPLDERVLNPTGFDATATAPAVDLSSLDLRDGATEDLIRSLRPVAGVRVSFGDADSLRSVARLAMAGIPLTATSAPAAALGGEVAAAITAPVDLGDPLAREEHSVVLRRAALNTFSSFAWRRAVGASIGVPVAVHPSVSIVLATRRPEQLGFALRQVAKQRGVERLELVLAPHGFAPDPARVRELVGSVTVQVVAQPESTLFGDVLAAAAAAASGDVVLKMDDDDWYAPDAVADLLLARAYSGAELVGMPAEFHYLTPKQMTVKRGHVTELYASFVAGGTLMVDRELLREVGSFRSVRKFVDAQLLAAVHAAGAAVYRTHGLGYLLRRNATGHTWEVDMDYLLDPSRVAATWEGFRPSRLLEHAESERPEG